MTTKRLKRLKYQKSTLLMLVLALVLLGVLIALAPLPKISLWGIDIYTFRAAAKAMALGENPYHEPNILRFADGVTVGNIHNFVYAPYFGFILRPLAWVNPVAASRLWFTLNLIFYFSSLILLIKAIGWGPSSSTFLLAMIGLILYASLRTTLIIGQSSFFLLFWFSVSYFLLSRFKPVLSGLSLSLALFKPHLAPLLLFYLIKRQWNLLFGFILGTLIITLPFFSYLTDWINSGTAAYNQNIGDGGCFRMVSITAMVQCFVPAGWPQAVVIALLLVGTFALLVPYFWQHHQPSDPIFDQHLALAIVLITLLLDNVRIADQMLLVFPLLVIWRDWYLFKNIWWQRTAIGFMMVIYILPYMVDFLQPYNIAFILPMWYLGVSLAVFTLLLLQIYLSSFGKRLE